jgi:hypothetical protein
MIKKNWVKTLGIMLVLSLVLCLTSAVAFANTSSVVFHINGSDITVTTAEMQGMGKTPFSGSYSSYNHQSQHKYYDAYGYELGDVVQYALDKYNSSNDPDISMNDIDTIEFVGSDDYSSDPISMSYLLTDHNYYPESGDPSSVPAIIVLQQATLGGTLSSTDCLRNFYGQNGSQDIVMNKWIKNLAEIYLTTN